MFSTFSELLARHLFIYVSTYLKIAFSFECSFFFSVLFFLSILLLLLPLWSIAYSEIKVSFAEDPDLWKVLPFKPGVGQTIASNATPAARNSASLICAFPANFIQPIFLKIRCPFF